ncbi:DUF4113 domain-containing protein [Desulfonatronum thioautotrophicum]
MPPRSGSACAARSEGTCQRWEMRQGALSPRYTTDWKELPWTI